jgi:hypothetical protein
MQQGIDHALRKGVGQLASEHEPEIHGPDEQFGGDLVVDVRAQVAAAHAARSADYMISSPLLCLCCPGATSGAAPTLRTTATDSARGAQ